MFLDLKSAIQNQSLFNSVIKIGLLLPYRPQQVINSQNGTIFAC